MMLLELKTKVKVKKWIDVEEPEKNKKFILDWHYYLLSLQEEAKTMDDAALKAMNMELLTRFYLTPYDGNRGFYEQFNERFVQ